MRSRPTLVGVPARFSATAPPPFYFPLAESVLSGSQTQPHVHNCTVSVSNGRDAINFEIFFKRHVHLPINRSIPLAVRKKFRGDVLIMRVGVNGERVVNMRPRDGVIADWAVQRYI